MQVDPIITTVKAPGTKRLKLTYDEQLSDVAFNFNVRRYVEAVPVAAPAGLGDEARRQLAAAQEELSAGLLDKVG